MLALLLLACHPVTVQVPPGPRAGVAADHLLASEAGAEVLRKGGNAVDAAIAAALSSGVVQPSGSGLGGGGFALVVTPEGKASFLDFREVAPASASRDMYGSGGSSTKGGLAVAVPAEGIGLAELHRRWGRADLATIAAPAIDQAREGFPTGSHLAEALLQVPMPGLFAEGNRRPGLASALEAWRDSDGAAFRTGWVAQDLVDSANAAGGRLTLGDLAAYTVKERAPLSVAWRGHTVWTAPPPSFGGIALVEMLGATRGEATLPCQVEAAKHAMAQRAAVGGDPDYTPVPVAALTSPAFLDQIRADCTGRTYPPDHYATAAPAPADAGTLHISVIDRDGMAVALTTTINTGFGSGVIATKSGIVLNNEMDDFAANPGVPNAYGLVQGEANAIAPGKRPLSSMSPTVVVDAKGRPVMAVGASGGPFIITATFQVLQAVMGEGLSVTDALAMPRWHHQWMPDVATIEVGFPGRAELEAAGHVTREIPKPFCSVQAVVRTASGVDAGADPRKGGRAVLVE